MDQDCARRRGDLGAYILGALDREESATMRGHLADCAACRTAYEYLLPVRDWLDSTRQHLAICQACRADYEELFHLDSLTAGPKAMTWGDDLGNHGADQGRDAGTSRDDRRGDLSAHERYLLPIPAPTRGVTARPVPGRPAAQSPATGTPTAPPWSRNSGLVRPSASPGDAWAVQATLGRTRIASLLIHGYIRQLSWPARSGADLPAVAQQYAVVAGHLASP